MTTPVSVTKEELRALCNSESPPSPGHKKRFLWENGVCELIFYSIYGFNILLACNSPFIIIWNTSPHLCNLLWSRRVVFPLFLVKILLLGSRSQWQRCMSYVVSAQTQTTWDVPSLCHRSEAVRLRSATCPPWPSSSPQLQLAAGTSEHQPHASCGIQ